MKTNPSHQKAQQTQHDLKLIGGHPKLWIVTGLLSIALLPGCQSPFSDADYKPLADTTSLHRIDAIDLDDYRSQTTLIETDTKTYKDSNTPAQLPSPQSTPEQVNKQLTEPIELDLAQCRSWALKYNLNLKVQRLNPTIAQTQVTEQQAAFEAVFFGQTGFTDSQSPTNTELQGSQTESRDTSLGVRIPMQTGGTVTFDFSNSRYETDNSFSTLNPSYTSRASVSLTQQLLRGAGQYVNTAPIQIAKLNTQIVDAQTKLEVTRAIAETDRIYWRLYAARQQLNVRQTQHELALQQLERAQRLVKTGAAAEVEIIRAEAGVTDGLQAIIVANNLIKQRQRELKRLMNKPGLDVDSTATIQTQTPANPIRLELDQAQLIQNALRYRTELLTTQIQLVQDSIQTRVQRNNTLPLAAFTYRYSRAGLDRYLGDSIDPIWDQNDDTHQLDLNVEIPLGNQAAKAALDRALLNRLQRTATQRLQTQQIKQEVLNALDTLEATWQRVLASRQSVLLQNRVLQAEQRQFELGLNTSTDVLNAQADLANAQSSEVQALVDYQIAQVDLAYATGTVLGSAQVHWQALDEDSIDLH